MATLLKDLLGCSAEVKTLRTHSGSGIPRSKYIAMALTRPDSVTLGETYTLDSQPVTVTATNLARVLRDLAFQGACYFFGDGTINGQKGKPTEITASKTFGSQTRAAATGEVNETAEFEFEHYFYNVPFFNELRKNTRHYDVYLFTDHTVQYIRYRKNRPQFHDLGHSIDNDITMSIQGGFSISWNDPDGELVPHRGVDKTDLDASSLRYTFGAATVTNLTAVAGSLGSCAAYRQTAAGAMSITRTINEAPGNGRYLLFYGCNEDLPAGVTAAIHEATGEVTLTTLPAGRHKFTVAYENEVGVFGTYCFEITSV